MQTIKRQTESFLFETDSGQIRAMPFYDLSIGEWVVFEKERPKYFLDFNRRDRPLIKDLTAKLNSGEGLEDIVNSLGRFLGRKWTTSHPIEGTMIPDSHHPETIELLVLDDIGDLFMGLTFVAADTIELDTLLNEDRLLETYGDEDKDGFLGLESACIDNYDNLNNLMTFLFTKKISLTAIASNEEKKIFDLTEYKQECISTADLEENYQEWIRISGRENTMSEYGFLLGMIGYINRNEDRNKLVLIAEKRRHF